jgi:hypothetical protein
MHVRYRQISRRTLLKWLAMSAAASSLPSLTGCTSSDAPDAPILPTVIPRSDWKAVAPDLNAPGEHGLYDPKTNPEGWLVYDTPLPDVLNTVVIHHSALPLSDGPHQIQYKHMHDKGFADIGYHFVIDDSGQIYAGRSLTVRGAHTGGHNTGTIGVVLMGNFEEAEPTPLQLANVKTLIRYLTSQYTLTHLAGHRDFQPEETVCPGKHLEPRLPDLAAELGLKFGTDGYTGPQTP